MKGVQDGIFPNKYLKCRRSSCVYIFFDRGPFFETVHVSFCVNTIRILMQYVLDFTQCLCDDFKIAQLIAPDYITVFLLCAINE